MTSLFLDTSSNYLTISVLKDNISLITKHEYLSKTLSKMALPYIKEVLDSLEIKPNDIDEIVCVNGPGSFTGLRVGVTISKTYAYSLNKKICGVSSLYTMATSIEDNYIIPIIDARHNHVFSAIYDKDYNIVMEECYISLEDLLEKVNKLDKSYTFVSNDSFDFNSTLYEPNINNLFKYLKKNYVEVHSFVPTYLKKTEAEENLNK